MVVLLMVGSLSLLFMAPDNMFLQNDKEGSRLTVHKKKEEKKSLKLSGYNLISCNFTEIPRFECRLTFFLRIS